ncbi:uncharacterized protein LOC103132579 isoform X1 [Poecilia formosa]|uniref:uncharacterized protein LOC103132579 isoform X1 n=1 Tax=Poecilia formosa TaxID=48698 RepID=UPI0004440C04|nr:PREDICTED: uncharacterized protein LOC103132579 isoform X1 [Poecilia formosa]XP_016522948.1 PREDICTED: uncharacterized protein LOC103132579 isoform X1 [Poecilia formosa]
MKMISLLLLILSSCLCAATFVVNVTQSSYEAEENHSITLEWTFTTRTQGSWKNLFIICEFRTSVKSGVIYVHHDGDEFPDSQDDQFSGRVQSDKDVLREGRIRLHVSRLRTEDSGLYRCNMKTEDGFNSGRCRLNVTAAADQIQTQRPTLTSEPERGRWTIIVIIALGVISAAALMFLLCYLVVKCCLPVDVYYSDAKETRDFNPLIVGNTLTNMRGM